MVCGMEGTIIALLLSIMNLVIIYYLDESELSWDIPRPIIATELVASYPGLPFFEGKRGKGLVHIACACADITSAFPYHGTVHSYMHTLITIFISLTTDTYLVSSWAGRYRLLGY